MALFRDKELFGYAFDGDIAPQPFTYGTVCTFSVHGTSGKGTLEDYTLGQMPHRLKDGSIDPEKVRRKGSIVLLSMNGSEFYQIDFDCLYPCDSPTTILDIKCIVQAEHPQVATRSLDTTEAEETVAARKEFQREQLVRKFLEDLAAIDAA